MVELHLVRHGETEYDAIYSSSLERARQTAAAVIAEDHEMEVQPVDRLQEIHLGVLEGKDTDEWHRVVREKGLELHEWAPTEGESMRDVEERTMDALDEFAAEHHDERILAVSHGAAIRAVIMSVLQTRRDRYPHLRQGNTALNRLEHDEEIGWILDTMNDTCHLQR